MPLKFFPRIIFLLTFITICFITKAQSQSPTEQILGRWMVAEKNLLVEVYRDGNDYKAKIIWFKNDDPTKRMEEWTDKHNPDPSQRDRKILGMNVVKDLEYDAKSKSWEHGKVYDAKSGKYWDASAYLTNDGLLKVTGYWHFKFIGRTMVFKKVS
jgi:uncharacterized protein (DUF2147 family)